MPSMFSAGITIYQSTFTETVTSRLALSTKLVIDSSHRLVTVDMVTGNIHSQGQPVSSAMAFTSARFADGSVMKVPGLRQVIVMVPFRLAALPGGKVVVVLVVVVTDFVVIVVVDVVEVVEVEVVEVVVVTVVVLVIDNGE